MLCILIWIMAPTRKVAMIPREWILFKDGKEELCPLSTTTSFTSFPS